MCVGVCVCVCVRECVFIMSLVFRVHLLLCLHQPKNTCSLMSVCVSEEVESSQRISEETSIMQERYVSIMRGVGGEEGREGL